MDIEGERRRIAERRSLADVLPVELSEPVSVAEVLSLVVSRKCRLSSCARL